MLFESNFFVNALRPEKDVHHFKFKTTSKGILIFYRLVCFLILQLLSLFLPISGLPCIWQQEKAVTILWNTLLSRELTSLKIRMGYVGVLYVLDCLAARYICGSEYHFTTTMQTIS